MSLSRTISSNTFWNIDCRSRRRRPRSICRPANGASTRGSVRAPPFQSSALRSLPRYYTCELAHTAIERLEIKSCNNRATAIPKQPPGPPSSLQSLPLALFVTSDEAISRFPFRFSILVTYIARARANYDKYSCAPQ